MTKDFNDESVIKMVKSMSHKEIVELREYLAKYDYPAKDLRCLWYDYSNQVWID